MSKAAPNPSLQTIADVAGVSRAAVSMALRNQGGISEKTRERIKKIAEEQGYRPNPMVSALMSHLKSLRPMPDAGSIAFITGYGNRDEWRTYPYFARYYQGAVERAQLAGYHLDEIWMREPGLTARKVVSILKHRGVSGILVAPLSNGFGHVSLDLENFSVATVGYSMVRPKVHRAVSNHMESLRLAVTNLRHLGYRRIGFAVFASQDRRSGSNWTAAYLLYQEKLAAKWRIPIHYLASAQLPELKDWLMKWKPDAILSGNAEILQTIAEAGFSVPEELGVAVLDLSPEQVGVAGIDQQPELIGAAAIDLVISQINRNERGIPLSPKIVMTEGIWIAGDTVRRQAGT